MPVAISQQEMFQIFEVTDALQIHREKLRVSLGKRDPGFLRKNEQGFLEIEIPVSVPFNQWLLSLADNIASLD